MQIDPAKVGRAKAAIKAALIARYKVTNRLSRRPVTGDCPVDLSLTSYGERLNIVGYVIESLAAQSVRPRRLVLWVDDPSFSVDDYPMLKRLVGRGLEIGRSENFGPHTKYFPYVEQAGEDLVPLATADDDVLYPRQWLETLWVAHRETPQDFVAHRAVSIVDDGEALSTYGSWRPTTSTTASHRTFVTGVGGVVYPPTLIRELQRRGREFTEVAPKADDVWINAVAVDSDIRGRWTGKSLWAWSFPRSQDNALHHENTAAGGNDIQIRRAYAADAVAKIVAEPAPPAATA